MASRSPSGTTGKSSRVDEQVNRLLSKQKISSDEFNRLRSRLSDDELVDKIQQKYMESYEMVEKRAKAFVSKLMAKYGLTNQPFSSLISKAHKYANKYGLSDAEKVAFTRILEQELAGAKRPDVPQITTNMSKVLGNISLETKGFGMKVSDADYRELQDILKMQSEDKSLHSQVILQSLSYKGVGKDGVVPLDGGFRPEHGHNKVCHVHPVIAALFLPKIDVLEHHFLYSNLANIVACRYNKEPFTTRPDYELFYNLVTDPNDVVCDSRSALKDLKNRCYLQKQVWQSVLNLRNGHFYNCDQLDLMKAIDMCRLNKYDTPDLVYGRYDGTVIKRLFAALSFSPTLVLSVPSVNVYSNNPYFQTATPLVSKISMINLRIPENNFKMMNPMMVSSSLTVSTDGISLKDALKQEQLLFENGSLVMKQTQTISTNGIICFFVDRRSHQVQYTNMFDVTAMTGLPQAISGFERVNTKSIKVPGKLVFDQSNKKEPAYLQSVVLAKTNDNNITDSKGEVVKDAKNLFIGSETYVIQKPEDLKNEDDLSSGTIECIQYDPILPDKDKVLYKRTEITSGDAAAPASDSGKAAAPTVKNIKDKGLIFIYKKIEEST